MSYDSQQIPTHNYDDNVDEFGGFDETTATD